MASNLIVRSVITTWKSQTVPKLQVDILYWEQGRHEGLLALLLGARTLLGAPGLTTRSKSQTVPMLQVDILLALQLLLFVLRIDQ